MKPLHIYYIDLGASLRRLSYITSLFTMPID
nr:MAG TPA: hypothetical protein [Caudoviricetes sp.]